MSGRRCRSRRWIGMGSEAMKMIKGREGFIYKNEIRRAELPRLAKGQLTGGGRWGGGWLKGAREPSDSEGPTGPHCLSG